MVTVLPISVHLYEDDPSFPAGLDGMFHGSGGGSQTRDGQPLQRPLRNVSCILLRHESKDAFYFAAEAKAILTVRPELRRKQTLAASASSVTPSVAFCRIGLF